MHPVMSNLYELNNENIQIRENTVVSLRYSMKNKNGEEIENTLSDQPVQYLHGAGKILPELERALAGLKTGDKRSLSIHIPDIFHFDVEIAGVRTATTAEIQTGSPIKESDCGPGCCC
jgi:FKBP-type peptidyl-prolyl cis-trans isomerase SlyD